MPDKLLVNWFWPVNFVVLQRCQLLMMSHFLRRGQPWTLAIWHTSLC